MQKYYSSFLGAEVTKLPVGVRAEGEGFKIFCKRSFEVSATEFYPLKDSKKIELCGVYLICSKRGKRGKNFKENGKTYSHFWLQSVIWNCCNSNGRFSC